MAHLTPAQKSVLDLAEFYKDTGITTLCGAVIFDEVLDRDIVSEAVRQILSKHENFNLRFSTADGRTVQEVAVDDAFDISHLSFSSIEELRGY
ncbi:MAG: hypothetical protein J5657_01375, partial [Clostridiales bacterium]|nr:hypothetical protein [Clostridiales bacterium]